MRRLLILSIEIRIILPVLEVKFLCMPTRGVFQQIMTCVKRWFTQNTAEVSVGKSYQLHLILYCGERFRKEAESVLKSASKHPLSLEMPVIFNKNAV